jgi:chaperone modulatory protein CbpM
MITIETILLEFHDLQPNDLERWIGNQWVRPEGTAGAWRFHEIDLARIRLILELRDTMEVSEPALPTVLSLLDQLYEMRRRMMQLNKAMEQTLPPDLRAALFRTLNG